MIIALERAGEDMGLEMLWCVTCRAGRTSDQLILYLFLSVLFFEIATDTCTLVKSS